LPIKIDPHIHSIYSDGYGRIEEILRIAKLKNLDGIAITDHNTIKGYLKAKQINNDKQFIIIPGIEVETDAGHIIILGIEDEPPRRGKMKYEEAIEWAKENNGLTILAHPAIGRFKLEKWIKNKPNAIEVINSLYPASILINRGLKLAEKLKLPKTAGSDAHHPEDIANAYTTINVNSLKIDEILEAIRRGEIKFNGKLSPIKTRIKIGLSYTLKNLIYKALEKH